MLQVITPLVGVDSDYSVSMCTCRNSIVVLILSFSCLTRNIMFYESLIYNIERVVPKRPRPSTVAERVKRALD